MSGKRARGGGVLKAWINERGNINTHKSQAASERGRDASRYLSRGGEAAYEIPRRVCWRGGTNALLRMRAQRPPKASQPTRPEESERRRDGASRYHRAANRLY